MAGKKITELSSGSLSNISLSGVTTVVYSGTTFQHSLSDLRNKLVDSGSHYFTGSQHIIGDLTVSGSITAHEYILSSSITNIEIQNISGSSVFGNDLNDTHNFTGSVNITGSLLLNNEEITITGSENHLAFFYGPSSLRHVENFHVLEGGNTLALGLSVTSVSGSDPEYMERLIVGGNSSHNIATFQESQGNHYTAVNIINYNDGDNASADLVIMNDIQNESGSYVNLGLNSTNHTYLTCGYEGDAYLYTTSRDLYMGSLVIGNGLQGNGHTHIFSAGAWRNPGISLYGNTSIGFFTEKQNNQLSGIPSFNQGFRSEFSGSVKMNNDLKVDGWISGSYFVGDGSQLINLPIETIDVSMFLSSSTFNSFTQSIDSRVNSLESVTSSYFTFNETTMSMVTGENMVFQTSYYGTVIGTATETATDSQGGQDTITFSAWIEGSGGIDYPSIVNVQPNWKASGPGLSVGATVASVNTLVFSPGQSVYQITLNTGYGLFQTSETYTFTEPDTSGTITKHWIFESGSNLIIPSGGNIIGAQNLATTGSNTFNGNQTITGSLLASSLTGSIDYVNITNMPTLVSSSSQISYSGLIGIPSGIISGSSQISNLGYAITGSNTFIGNQTITGSLNIEGVGGNEGGEIQLGLSQTNTTLSGSIIFDVYTDKLRLFEGGGNNRGAFLNVASQSNNVSSEIVTSETVSKIETITSASYALITPVSGTLYIIIG